MASPICIRFKDKSQHPYKRVAVLVDHDEYMKSMLANGSPAEHRMDITNCRDWQAFSLAGFSLILIWK